MCDNDGVRIFFRKFTVGACMSTCSVWLCAVHTYKYKRKLCAKAYHLFSYF